MAVNVTPAPKVIEQEQHRYQCSCVAESNRTPTTATFSTLPDLVRDSVEVESECRFGNGRVIDVAAGLSITPLIGAGVTINMANRQGPVTIVIRENRVLGSSDLEGSRTLPGLERSDESISVSGVFVVPLHGRVQAKAFGGPSYIHTSLDFIHSAFAMPLVDLTSGGAYANGGSRRSR